VPVIRVPDDVYERLEQDRLDGESHGDALQRRLDLDGRYLTAEEIDGRIERRLEGLREGRR